MIKIFLFTLYFNTSILAIDFRGHRGRHLPTIVANDITSALFYDNYFGYLEVEKKLASGSYGSVFLAYHKDNPDDKVAVKVSILKKIEIATYDNAGSVINQLNDSSSTYLTSIMMMDYMKEQNVPFTIRIKASRLILSGLKIDGNESHFGSNICALEYGDFGTLDNYARILNDPLLTPPDKKEALALDIIFNIALSLSEINKLKIIHGDIKPDNIFVRSCEITKSKICPIIGDWDLAHHIENTPSSLTKYTVNYRPPELIFYRDIKHDSLFIGEGGYKYTGKEDVFAFAITIIKFLHELQLENLLKNLKNILSGMLYPLTYDQAIKYYITSKNLENPTFVFNKALTNKIINQKYLDAVNEFVNKIKNNQRKFNIYIKAKDLFSEIKNIEQALPHNPLVSYYMINKEIIPFLINDKHLNINLKNELMTLYEKISQFDPFLNIKQNRWSMSKVFAKLASKFFSANNEVKINEIINTTKNLVLSENQKQYTEPQNFRNMLNLADSFYELSHDYLYTTFKDIGDSTNFDTSMFYNERGELIYPGTVDTVALSAFVKELSKGNSAAKNENSFEIFERRII